METDRFLVIFFLMKTHSYENQIRLTGILYLHRITDVRMLEATQRNLRMFGRICGSLFAKRVLFVTTMWDKVLPPRGEEREEELQKQYLKPMLDLGATMVRSKNESFQAWTWVSRLLTSGDDKPAALIQEEMVDRGMKINETRAAQTLRVRLQEALAEHREAIEEIYRVGRADASDLQKLKDELLEINCLEIQLQTLKIPVMRRIQLSIFKRPKGVYILFESSQNCILMGVCSRGAWIWMVPETGLLMQSIQRFSVATKIHRRN
jgi:hypothetical protein